MIVAVRLFGFSQKGERFITISYSSAVYCRGQLARCILFCRSHRLLTVGQCK